MRHAPLSAVALILAGCTGSSFGYSGYNTHDYFATDGDRNWKYVMEDGSVEWRMEVDKLSSTTVINDTTVYTFEYGSFDPAELFYSIDWSADGVNGIQIHGFTIEGGDSVSFGTPIQVSDPQMTPGEVIETTSEGYTISSTFTSTATCPNEWVTEDWNCLVFTISDGVEDETSPPFVGTWEFAADWGASRFKQPGYSADWVLSEASWSPDE